MTCCVALLNPDWLGPGVTAPIPVHGRRARLGPEAARHLGIGRKPEIPADSASYHARVFGLQPWNAMTLIRFGIVATLWLLLASLAGADTPDTKSSEFWYGTAADGGPTVRLYYFFSPTCPHCQAAKPFLDEMAARKPWLEIKRYPVKDNRDNARFYFDTAKSLGVEALSIPGFVFCRQVMIGFDSAATTGADLEKALDACHAERLANPGATRRRQRRRRHQRRPPRPDDDRLPGARLGRPPSLHRHRQCRSALAASADAGAGRHGRLQSLRVLRAALPAEPAGACQEPHPDADRRRDVRAVLGHRLLRLHGGVAERVPDRRRAARDHDRRGAGGAHRRGAQHQGLFLVQGRAQPVHSGRGKTGPVQAHARGGHHGQHGADAGEHGAAGDRGELVRTAVHGRLPDGLYARADARQPRAMAVLRVACRLQRDLRAAAARHRHRVHPHHGCPQAERVGGPHPQARLRIHDARLRPRAAFRAGPAHQPFRVDPRAGRWPSLASVLIAKIAAPRPA